MAYPMVLWCDVMTARGDLGKALDKVVQAAGPANVILRFFTQYIWGGGIHFMPFLQATTPGGAPIFFTHPTTHIKQVVYDLHRYNPAWIFRFSLLNTLCWQKRIYLCPTLHDYRNPDKTTKYYYPFRCSLQGLGTDNVALVTPKEAQSMFAHNTDGIYGDKLKPEHEKFAKWIMSLMTANYFMEAANEFSRLTWPTTAVPLKWHKWFVDTIQADLPVNRKGRIVTSGLVDDGIKNASHFSWHGVGNIATYGNAHSHGLRKSSIVSADGFFSGTGRPDAKGRHGSSVSEAKAVAISAKADGLFAVETMDRGLWFQDNANMNLDLYDASTLKAVTDVLHA